MMTDEKKKEYTLRISQANRTGLTVIIYEMLFDYMDEIAQQYEAKNHAGFRDAIRKASGCVRELLNSLDYGYELSRGLSSIYLYVSKTLALMEVKNHPENLEEIRKIMEKLCESFQKVSEQDNSAPLMQNTQAVYTGLTYGPNTLNNNMVLQPARGVSV